MDDQHDKEETEKKEVIYVQKGMTTANKVLIGVGIVSLVTLAGGVIYNCMKKSSDKPDDSEEDLFM